jgi:hypothetical protein
VAAGREAGSESVQWPRYRIDSSDRTVSDISHAVSLSASEIQSAKKESSPSPMVMWYPRLDNGS